MTRRLLSPPGAGTTQANERGRGALGGEGTEQAGSRSGTRRASRVFAWQTSRRTTTHLPAGLALLLVTPFLLAIGVATIGLFAAGLAGLFAAPRLIRRTGGRPDERSATSGPRRPTITLDRGDYTSVD